MKKISGTSGKKASTRNSGCTVESTLNAVELETISEVSHSSRPALSSGSISTETSRTQSGSQFRFLQSTSKNDGEGTSGTALEAHGQLENLRSSPCMLSADRHERSGPSGVKRKRKRRRHSQESALYVSVRVSSSAGQGHTHSPSSHCRNVDLVQDHQSTLGTSQVHPPVQAVPSSETAMRPQPPVTAEEPLTSHRPATSAQFLPWQQPRILLLRHHDRPSQGIIPTFSVQPQTIQGPTLKMLEEQLLEAQAEIQELNTLLKHLEEDGLCGQMTSSNDKLPYYRFDCSSHQFEQNQCVVCMCDFQEQQLLRVLPCRHVFHTTCVNKWLESNNSCPICRIKVKRASR